MGVRCSRVSACLWPPDTKHSTFTDGLAENGHGHDYPAFAFEEFSLEELRAATDGFSTHRIVSEHGEKAPNIVYRATLFRSGRTAAVKRFPKSAWPDSKQFLVTYSTFFLMFVFIYICIYIYIYPLVLALLWSQLLLIN